MTCGGHNTKWNNSLIGKKYSYLTILGLSSKKWKSCRDIFVICKCICGKIIEPRFYDLRKERQKSCGCQQIRHITHGLSDTKLYSVWKSMKERCNNPNNKSYKYYGGRGITICSKWNDFLTFRFQMRKKYFDAKKKYKKEPISIERVYNNGNYCYENCIFTTMKEQSKNKRNIYPIKATNRQTGEEVYEKTKTDLAKKINLTHYMINQIILKKKSSIWIIRPLLKSK